MTAPLKMDGHDNAIIGLADVWDSTGHRNNKLIYCARRLVKNLRKMGMNQEEAEEWISVNMEGAYVGPGTPIISWPMTAAELAELDFDE